MTPKLGEAPSAALVQARLTDPKSPKLGDFFTVLQRALAVSVLRPAELPAGLAGAPAEVLAEGLGHFTRGGTALEGDGRAADRAPIDALELSLSRPPDPAVRVDVAKSAHVALDALELAALERVVERLSFGSDRRAPMARLELGGIWAGAVLVVRASGRDVELQVELASGVAAPRELGERLAARLRSRGFATALSFG